MTQAMVMEEAVANENNLQQETNKTLRDCVEDTIEVYFRQLQGHSTNELYKMVLQEVEEPLFRCVLRYTGGNQSKASEVLGINRGTLRKKLKLYGLHE